MLDKTIGNAEPYHVARIEAGAIGGLKESAAETTFERALFHGNHKRHIFDGTEQRLLVERLGEASVDDADAQALLAQAFGCRHASREKAAESDENSVVAPFVHFGLAQFYRGHAAFHLFQTGFGIANGDRSFM